jgi:hypothetical protein
MIDSTTITPAARITKRLNELPGLAAFNVEHAACDHRPEAWTVEINNLDPLAGGLGSLGMLLRIIQNRVPDQDDITVFVDWCNCDDGGHLFFAILGDTTASAEALAYALTHDIHGVPWAAVGQLDEEAEQLRHAAINLNGNGAKPEAG